MILAAIAFKLGVTLEELFKGAVNASGWHSMSVRVKSSEFSCPQANSPPKGLAGGDPFAVSHSRT
jgi:hypothetical protein